MSWHSEEALHILIKKYDNLIISRLERYNVLRFHYKDYIQELRMSVLEGIKKYDENYGKSLCRFLELIIDRRIIRLLKNDIQTISTVRLNEEIMNSKYKNNILEEMVYESKLKELIEVDLDDVKKDILHKVLIEGMTIKEYSEKHNLNVKDVYNHIYLLRLKLKGKLNL